MTSSNNFKTKQKDIFIGIKFFAFGILALILSKIVDVLWPHPVSVNPPQYLILYPICLACFIWALVRLKLNIVTVCASFFVLLVLVTFSGAYFKPTFLLEKWRLALFSARYAKCETSAIPLGNGKALALCENYDRGGYADGIAFDSSDEIFLPLEARSAAWIEVAKQDPMFDQFDFTAQKLGEHFYYVNFDLLGSPPFTPLSSKR